MNARGLSKERIVASVNLKRSTLPLAIHTDVKNVAATLLELLVVLKYVMNRPVAVYVKNA